MICFYFQIINKFLFTERLGVCGNRLFRLFDKFHKSVKIVAFTLVQNSVTLAKSYCLK